MNAPLSLPEPDGTSWIAPSRVSYDRELVAREGFSAFVELAWSHVPTVKTVDYVDGWHIDEMCEHFEAFTERSRFVDLVINIPPGHSKSMIASVLWPAWLWIERPWARVLTASYAPALARKNAQDSLDLMRSAWYVARWGNKISKFRGVTDFYTAAGGNRHTTTPGGAGGGGRHFHFADVDDPVKLSAGASIKEKNEALAKANDWFGNTLGSRKAEDVLYTALTMQRLHEKDPSQIMIDRGAVQLRLPILFERENRCVTPIGGDRRTVGNGHQSPNAEILHPQRFTRRAIDKLAKDLFGWDGPIAQAQLQQHPNPPGGAIFKAENFRRFTVQDMPFERCISALSVDCTFKAADGTDYVAFEVWGAHYAKRYCYYSHTQRLGFWDTCKMIIALLQQWPVNVVLVEDKANGSAVIETFRQLIPNVYAIEPQGGKEARAWACQPQYASGAVHHLDAPWTAAKETNLVKFPNGAHDDDVDATTQALLFLAKAGPSIDQALKAWSASGGAEGLARMLVAS